MVADHYVQNIYQYYTLMHKCRRIYSFLTTTEDTQNYFWHKEPKPNI